MENIYARQSTGQVRSTPVGKETLQEALIRLGWSSENIIVIDEDTVIHGTETHERVDMHRLYQLMQQKRFAEKAQYN